MKSLERNDNYIELPCSLILTKDGISCISGSNLKIKSVKNHMGIHHDGIDSVSYNAETLQKMVMNAYLEEIFVSQPELLNKRYEIISTNNLIVFAILYKKLSPTVWDMFTKSRVVKNFNRKNPKNAIVSLNQLNRRVTKEVMQNEKKEFDELKQELLIEVIKLVQENNQLSDEDKKLQIQCLDKFIAWIDDRIWYIFYIISKTDLKRAMLVDFASIVAEYLKKTQIAVHLSNLLMELVQNAEKSHLERVVIRNDLAEPGDANKFLRKSLHRERACKIAKRNNDNILLSWSVNPESATIGHQYRIHITLVNHAIVNDFTQEIVNKKMNTNVEGISIAEFYSNNPDNDNLGAGLGLLYHSYLEDYCRHEGIVYNCNIIPETRYERTTVSLDIAL